MKFINISIAFALSLIISFSGITPRSLANELISKAPSNAELYFIQPQNGSTVSPTFTVKFGLSGMGIAPAGVEKKNTGHHHLLIDLDELPNLNESLSATEHIKHFGGGQTETKLTLTPGEHTLQLVLGNYVHIPHNPPVISKKITISVR